MNARVFLSINIIAVSVVLLLLPGRVGSKGQPLPSQQVQSLDKILQSIDVDKAARIINQTDSSYQLIDVRTAEEYLAFSLPGTINIPFDELMAPQWQGYLKQDDKTNVLYSNGDYLSNMAVALLEGKGYDNNITLKGGMNAWYAIVMNTEFKGGRLTARENALYENRANAKKLFVQINSLPDSLKNNFLEAKLLAETELDGGCE
jgi:rhodanese-related sulfurtransferase